MIYEKTPLGAAALQHRAQPLPRRAWQLLLMLDGRRDETVLAKMYPAETLHDLLAILLGEGLIQPAANAKASQEPVAAALDDSDAVENARNLMINTTLSFAGHVGGELVRKLRAATTLGELRNSRDEWHKMLAMNPMAMMQLPTIERHLDRLF